MRDDICISMDTTSLLHFYFVQKETTKKYFCIIILINQILSCPNERLILIRYYGIFGD